MGERPTQRRSEQGVATIWGLGWVVVCAFVGGAIVTAAFALARQHDVDSAADLAAIAGAAAIQHGHDACDAAADLSMRRDVALRRCDVEGETVVVEVSADLDLPLGLHARIGSTARAGPA